MNSPATATSEPPRPPRTRPHRNHIAAFFHNRDEEYDVLLPFIRAGFKRGDKAVHIVDPRLREEHIRRLRKGSIDTDAAEARKQLEIKVWKDTYLRSGHFDSDDTMRIIDGILTRARAEGFRSTRLIAHAEWILQEWEANYLEYESGINRVLAIHSDPVICVYNCAHFDARVIMDMLRCHPAVMISSVLHRNPFYVEPDELMEDMRSEEGSLADLLDPSVTAQSRQIHRAISDLIALSTLPAEWAGRAPGEIADQILSILIHCPRIDAAYVRLREGRGVDVARIQAEGWPQFQEWLKNIDCSPPGSAAISQQRRIELPANGKTLYVLQIPLGIEAQAGWIALGSAQPDFPNEMETLMITVAANQGLTAFQNALLLHERERVATAFEVVSEDIERTGMFDGPIGSSRAIRKAISQISKVAPTDSTVLLTGETGTGKELAARAIHKRSRRARQPFISVNCAALPASLIASELFGHEKGAFTGAEKQRLGRFELADKGTLFLDEIGELSLEIQAALLRVLQERVIERLGAAEHIRVDVRLIAATNRDLEQAVAEGIFRSDLYYRLHVFPIEMPPLRDRTEDIPLLTRHFIDRYAATLGKKITRIDPATMDRFQSYRWPGNIRELQNVVERSLILCEDDTFSAEAAWSGADPLREQKGPLFENLASYERSLIENALRDSGGKVSGDTGAAQTLGIPSTTLESRIKALNINKNRFRA